MINPQNQVPKVLAFSLLKVLFNGITSTEIPHNKNNEIPPINGWNKYHHGGIVIVIDVSGI